MLTLAMRREHHEEPSRSASSVGSDPYLTGGDSSVPGEFVDILQVQQLLLDNSSAGGAFARGSSRAAAARDRHLLSESYLASTASGAPPPPPPPPPPPSYYYGGGGGGGSSNHHHHLMQGGGVPAGSNASVDELVALWFATPSGSNVMAEKAQPARNGQWIKLTVIARSRGSRSQSSEPEVPIKCVVNRVLCTVYKF